MDVLVAPQPTIVFGLMGVQVVQDDVDLPARMIDDDAVHEMPELDAPAAPVMAGVDQAGDHIQGREQGRGAMAFVLVVETGERFAVGQLQPALGALQRLDVGLLVHREHHGILRRLQIECDDVGGLLRERRIGADAPAPPPLQRDLVLPQHPPDLVLGDIAQMLGQQGAIPTRISGRRRRIQSRENPRSSLAS